MWQLSIRSKIILALLLTGQACLVAGGVIGYLSARKALTKSVEQLLTAQREVKRRRIEVYIKNQLRFTAAISESPETTEATKDLIAAFRKMSAETAADPADTAALKAWYIKDLVPRMDKVAGSHTPVDGLMPVDAGARRLQADYIARNSEPDGEKDKLVAAPGGSSYDVAHSRYHPLMKRLEKTIGFYDINLVDAATGDVVYTVAKEADFASNVYHGPMAQSGLARAVRRALDPLNGGNAVVEGFSDYLPSGFQPQMFTAAPIVVDGEIIGVLSAQLDISVLNNLMTDDNGWRTAGMGETGEALLVNEDRLLSNQSRFMTEDSNRFLVEAEANGLPASTIDRIRSLGTTILNVPLRTDEIEEAFHNKKSVGRYRDYRGVDVISAYGPVEVAGLRWAISVKQDVAEAYAPIDRLSRDLLLAAAMTSILLTFLALVCARLFTRPLGRIIAGMRAVSGGANPEQLAVHGNDEFAELARGFNGMAATINERDKQIVLANQEKSELLRSIYPVGVAERVRSGAEVTAETVSNVTVGVVLIDGLDALASARNANEVRDILNVLLDALNVAAAGHGVEPVSSLGESYIGVCGLSSPRLDHATRTLAWVRNATLAVHRLGDDWARSISLRFGLASGEIDVLLIGRGHAAYDIWGRTLSVARRIVQEVEPSCVRVSAATYALLLDVDGFQPCAPIEMTAFGAIETWSRPTVISHTAVKQPLPAESRASHKGE